SSQVFPPAHLCICVSFFVSCPAGKGWVYFSGSLYQVSSTKKTWDQSRSDCRQKGADLLIINSEEEQVSQFTRAGPKYSQRAFANRFQKYMWIGLTDVTNEGSWKWVDGTFKGAERRGKDENCVDIKNFNAEKSWNDESCSLSLLWICEKKLFLYFHCVSVHFEAGKLVPVMHE
uniref:C-type lectin domain-containing protein n=1 Tax=Takifugu rubripes TaxID=31033 RepID=A0A3B5KBJ6_TAKRU